jgi:signal transduction histidine kinase
MESLGLLTTLSLLINGLTILFALVMLLQILWQESRTALNLSFAMFSASVMLWSGGSLIGRATAYVGAPTPLTALGLRLLEIGFTGACVSLYLFGFALTGSNGRRFVWVALLSVGTMLGFQGVIFISGTPPLFSVRADGALIYNFSPLSIALHGSFVVAALLVAWQRQRKIKGRGLLLGIAMFAVGVAVELVSPEWRYRAVGINISAIAALIISYAMLSVQIIEPLAGRAKQLQAVRDVGLAITSRLRLEEVLSAIAAQAAGILKANGAAIYLNQQNELVLAAVHNMPNRFLGQRLALGEGIAGQVAQNRQSFRVDDYKRDWQGKADMNHAKESFGAVAATPLIFAGEVMGVLMVMEGVQGKRFDREDIRLLELLSPQAAVAISNSRLFEQQRALSDALSAARDQLEAVLSSADNPILALDRRLQVLFANPAASALLEIAAGDNLPQRLGAGLASLMPPAPLATRRAVRTVGFHRYELALRGRTYRTHVGALRRSGHEGYVLVLNDITDLRALDQQKTQMIQMTSHQLKNPLFAAMSSFEMLRDEFPAEGEAVQYLDDIWAALERMERIVQNILNIERLSAGGLNVAELDLADLVRAVLRDFASQAHKAQISLRAEPEAEALPSLLVAGSWPFLLQALANLVENALKFTQAGGEIVVKLAQIDGQAILSVSDSGVGIPPEALPRVFERFYRANQPGTSHIGGSGLGLSLVSAVIDTHKGRVWIESQFGQGTTIWLALPLQTVPLTHPNGATL